MNTIWTSTTHWNQYRSPSARAAWWDYRSKGIYLVTIRTYKGLPFFGHIEDGAMHLSDMGRIAEEFWKEIPEHTAAGVVLDSFVVMPNHIHGIVIIEEPCEKDLDVEPLHATALQAPTDHPSLHFSQIAPKKGSLSSIVRSFKSAVTKTIRRQLDTLETPIKDDFRWQDRFHDRILRSEYEYEQAVHYVDDNVQQWKTDDYYCLTMPSIQRGDANAASKQAPPSLPHHKPTNSRTQQAYAPLCTSRVRGSKAVKPLCSKLKFSKARHPHHRVFLLAKLKTQLYNSSRNT